MREHHPASIQAVARKRRFTQLFESSQSRLEGYALAVCRGDHDAAADVLADALLNTYLKLDTLRDENAFARYVITAMRRAEYRGWKRRGIFSRLTVDIEDRSASGTPAPDRSYDVQRLYAALEALPARQRDAVTLFEIAGFSLKEITEIQGGTLSGVKTRIARARRALAHRLAD